jgi:hypothetical protein
MALWRPLKQFFLDEIMCTEGLGYSAPSPCCAVCKKADESLFKCAECGEFLQCKTCCVQRHVLTPLHLLKVRTSLERGTRMSSIFDSLGVDRGSLAGCYLT